MGEAHEVLLPSRELGSRAALGEGGIRPPKNNGQALKCSQNEMCTTHTHTHIHTQTVRQAHAHSTFYVRAADGAMYRH